jgi:hypothetical protein
MEDDYLHVNSMINYVYLQSYENICIAEVGLVNVRLENMLGYYIGLSTPSTTLPNVLICENVRHSAANIRAHAPAQRPKLIICTETRNSASPWSSRSRLYYATGRTDCG